MPLMPPPPADLVAQATPTQPKPAEPIEAITKPLLQDRQALLALLRTAIRTDDDPAMDKALAAAALTLTDPERVLDPLDLAPLEPQQRDQVLRYHRLIVMLAQQLSGANGELDAQAVMGRVQLLFGEHPIKISTAALCRRVRGYGVYEPFESHTFLAGRAQPMIVYAELEHFHTTQNENGLYEVKLAQEVVLYNETDGLMVWQQPQVEIVDESRNQRRDFFVVQMIRLPARLTVGKYLMKVRVEDLNGGSLDEQTLPIQIVADQSLAGTPQRADAP